jgi:hypothetical protein
MLRGLPGIQLKLEFVRRNSLGEHSLILALVCSFPLRDRSTNTIFWLAPHQVLYVFQLAYLNEVKQCRCMNAYKCNKQRNQVSIPSSHKHLELINLILIKA